MNRDEIIQKVIEEKVIAIVRGVDSQKLVQVADALYEGGIRLMEITFDQNQPDTWNQTAGGIRAVAQKYKGKMYVGAGTVTKPEHVDLAADAGGQFIISPDVNAAVIARTLERGLVSMPGALTPTEVMQAHELGADFVKLFPAGNLGVAYIKAVRAPLNHIRLLAVGGVNADNFSEFMDAGLLGAGIGGNLVKKDWVKNNEFEKITEMARKYAAVAHA